MWSNKNIAFSSRTSWPASSLSLAAYPPSSYHITLQKFHRIVKFLMDPSLGSSRDTAGQLRRWLYTTSVACNVFYSQFVLGRYKIFFLFGGIKLYIFNTHRGIRSVTVPTSLVPHKKVYLAWFWEVYIIPIYPRRSSRPCRLPVLKYWQESCAIAKMTAQCAMRPIHGCPENFRYSLTTPSATTHTTFSWAFVSIDPMNNPTKFEVRSFTRSWDNRGVPKNLGIPWIRPRSPFSKSFNGLLFGLAL